MSANDPLDTFAKITQDYPKYTHLIAKLKLDNALNSALIQNQMNVIPSGVNKLFLNNLEVDIDTDLFR